MKKLVLGLLLTGGFLMAEEPAQQPLQPEPQQHSEHVGYFQRIALETQDPHVTVKGRHENRTKEGYRVVENHSTIVAYAPWGK